MIALLCAVANPIVLAKDAGIKNIEFTGGEWSEVKNKYTVSFTVHLEGLNPNIRYETFYRYKGDIEAHDEFWGISGDYSYDTIGFIGKEKAATSLEFILGNRWTDKIYDKQKVTAFPSEEIEREEDKGLFPTIDFSILTAPITKIGTSITDAVESIKVWLNEKTH